MKLTPISHERSTPTSQMPMETGAEPLPGGRSPSTMRCIASVVIIQCPSGPAVSRDEPREKWGLRRSIIAVALLVALTIGIGCTTSPPPEDTYVTDYRVVDERTVKYLYLTGEKSLAGSAYGNQALALEICSVAPHVDEETGEEGEVVETDCETTRILKTEEYR